MSDIALGHADARERPVDDASQLFAGPHQVEVLEVSVHETWLVARRGLPCDAQRLAPDVRVARPAWNLETHRGEPARSNRLEVSARGSAATRPRSVAPSSHGSFGSSSMRPGRRVISSAGAPACSPDGSVASRSGVGKEQDVSAVSTAASWSMTLAWRSARRRGSDATRVGGVHRDGRRRRAHVPSSRRRQ